MYVFAKCHLETGIDTRQIKMFDPTLTSVVLYKNKSDETYETKT